MAKTNDRHQPGRLVRLVPSNHSVQGNANGNVQEQSLGTTLPGGVPVLQNTAGRSISLQEVTRHKLPAGKGSLSATSPEFLNTSRDGESTTPWAAVPMHYHSFEE